MSLRIAVEGCCHGELNKIYKSVTSRTRSEWPELLVICGDFQSIRNNFDLNSLAVPQKYKRFGDFVDYYEGRKKAPILTIFIGGNHEASNYLQQLPYGGWVAPNIYFMGYSNVIWYKGIRIGGISGIFKSGDFYSPHWEKAPYNNSTKRSVYHTRFIDVFKLFLVRNKNLNCFVSHDWPEGIAYHGDLNSLVKQKPFFKDDIEKHDLGSTPNMILLNALMPQWWFSAHLHVFFEAVVKHENHLAESCGDSKVTQSSRNDDEIDLDFGSDEEAALDEKIEKLDNGDLCSKGSLQTNFIALDKCLRNRKFVEYMEIQQTNQHDSDKSESLYHDLEYLKILKWAESFQKTEAFSKMRMEDLNHDLVDHFWKDIEEVEIPSTDLRVPLNFNATKQNPLEQTNEFRQKFAIV